MCNLSRNNLSALKNRYPDLVDRLSQTTSLGEVVPAKNGLPTLKVSHNKKVYHLHSAYDPVREAARWAQNIYAAEDDTLLVCGIGLGYHINRLSLLYPKARIVAMEPDLSTFKTALNAVDLTSLINKENIVLYFGAEKKEINKIIEKQLNIYQPEKLKLLAYLPALRNAGDNFKELEESANAVVADHILHSNTLMRFSFDWTENFLCNLPATIQAPDVDILCGPFKGVPGVIVAAGPSLDKNIHLLKEIKNKAVIIAAGTAFKAILSLGIEPDLVVTVDGGEPNAVNFENVEVKDSVLIFSPVTYKSIPANFKGPKIVGAYDPYFMTWLENFIDEKRTLLKGGPSVANVSFDLAVKAGLDPIIFIGQDLAYTGGKTHSQRTIYEGRTVSGNEQLVEVEGYGGDKKVETSHSLACFLHWYEEEIPLVKDQVKIINATEGGARIPGTEEMPFREAIDRYLTKEYPIDKTIKRLAVKKDIPLDVIKNICFDLKETKKCIRRVKKYTRSGLQISQKLEDLYRSDEMPPLEKIDPLKEKLEYLDQKIFEQQKAFPWLEAVISPAYQKFARVGEEEAVEQIEKTRNIIEQSCAFYTDLNKAAEKIEEWINRPLDSFNFNK
ncbi:MAG: Uncharacterized protein XD78_0178 [Desulfotomaculum sp. 46_296]|nr:MAG: Uncharacterized protein XD78_0178 [Desulfotomaculum sp. 46_296]HAU32290.1 hypothetical protein [Desulfotomaculum sp.]